MGNKFAIGVVVGIGVKWASPHLLPVIGAVVRPITQLDLKALTKAGIKVGWLGLERGRELVAYVGETLQDALAEARHELTREAPAPADES